LTPLDCASGQRPGGVRGESRIQSSNAAAFFGELLSIGVILKRMGRALSSRPVRSLSIRLSVTGSSQRGMGCIRPQPTGGQRNCCRWSEPGGDCKLRRGGILHNIQRGAFRCIFRCLHRKGPPILISRALPATASPSALDARHQRKLFQCIFRVFTRSGCRRGWHQGKLTPSLGADSPGHVSVHNPVLAPKRTPVWISARFKPR